MNLRGIANRVTSSVNPNEVVRVLRSDGYTIGPGRVQIPAYATPVDGPAQLQPLSSDDLTQVDGLNLQGVLKAIYLRGKLAGVVRPNEQGGDLVMRGPEFAEKWLVVKVLEDWPTWTKAVIQLQLPEG